MDTRPKPIPARLQYPDLLALTVEVPVALLRKRLLQRGRVPNNLGSP
jgi:ribose 1,5-bisphosphokinase PhnN